jgi:hypothetical protein
VEEEDEYSVESKPVNPFVRRGARREYPIVQAHANQWEAVLNISEFHGCLQPEEFLDWVAALEGILEIKEVPDEQRVSVVATKFKGRVAAWWQQLKQTRVRQGKTKIDS